MLFSRNDKNGCPGRRGLELWRKPFTFTSIVPLGECDPASLHDRLRSMERQWISQLASVEDLHSFRLVVVPPDKHRGWTSLLFNSVHDNLRDRHLPALLQVVDEGIRETLGQESMDHKPMLDSSARFQEQLLANRVCEQTFHLGAINQSVQSIRQERHLRETLQNFADARLESGDWDLNTPPETMKRQALDYILQGGDPMLPKGPSGKIGPEGKRKRFLSLLETFALPTIGVLKGDIDAAIRAMEDLDTRAAARIAFTFWWVYGALPTGAALTTVRMLENREPEQTAPLPDPEKVRRLEAREDFRLKNAVTLWFPIKNSLARRILTGLILWGSDRGCRHFWTRGALADIDTIHYARIMQVDNGHTMLFMSDFDGSLNRYLDDFIGVGSRAVIPISSNVAGCPKTRWLFNPEDPNRFGPHWRRMIRSYQLENAVWYSAYPNLTVNDILKNHQIREGLFDKDMSRETSRKWLGLL